MDRREESRIIHRLEGRASRWRALRGNFAGWEEDLVHTIGESAFQGAAGVILWGSTNFSKSREACLEVKEYVDTLLGPYIMNVTSSTKLCSKILCSKNGRCVRQENHPEAFLHLNSDSFTIKKHNVYPGFILIGQMSVKDQIKMAQEFTCQCYDGWRGLHCEEKSIHNEIFSPLFHQQEKFNLQNESV
ncbi:hyaluronidase-1 isoform X2 [Erythrolamprus reginae]|uniref:hyaluronidase-1 isoform X2 n=1 Tax=Erythrolamprus reginae TaxID=121349 RepID=UPI00396CF458